MLIAFTTLVSACSTAPPESVAASTSSASGTGAGASSTISVGVGGNTGGGASASASVGAGASGETSTGAGGAPGSGLGTAMTSPMACPTTAPPGATCVHLVADCTAATGAPPLGATVVVVDPQGTAKGTIFLHSGGPGTTVPSSQPVYVSAGFRTVAIGWDSTWEDTPSLGILAAACRPATAMKWAFDQPHHASRSAGFCAQGGSAGSAVIAYALAHYGMGAYLDYANLVSGPPLGRIDYGCAPATYTGPPRTVCAGASGALSPAPYAFTETWALNLVNGGENTTSCGSPNPAAADIARWAADSVVSPGAVYDYPQTPLRFFYCTSATTNEVTGLGSFFYESITSTKSEACYTNCTGEGVQQDPAGKADVDNSMLSNCIPRHQP